MEQATTTTVTRRYRAALISSGHKLLELVRREGTRLYPRAEYDRHADSVSLETWNGAVMPSIRQAVSDAVSLRVTAAARRARDNAEIYGVRVPGDAELAAEALFDDRLFKVHKSHLSRRVVRDQIKRLASARQPLRIALPLFSRKPVCPLKNHGPLPDLAEIASLARCYEVGSLLSWFYPHGVAFRVFADGHKYRRACLTPPGVVDAYQSALRYWCDRLGIAHRVTVLDYESAVRGALGDAGARRREAQYEETLADLHGGLDVLFDPTDVAGSLRRLDQASPLAQQAKLTFQTMLTSTYYRTGGVAERLAANDDAAQVFYLEYILNLREKPGSPRQEPAARREAEIEMRREAWAASLRYIAISLADRALDVWSLLNHEGLKFTSHGKPGEIHFRSTSSDLLCMTAQHCAGGIKRDARGSKFTFAYRVERESRGERPLLLSAGEGERGDAPVRGMLATRQPICYLAASILDPRAALEDYLAHD